jgi:hypothetical protein
MNVTLKTGETVAIPPNALPIEVPECGCCGHYHLRPLLGVFTEDYRDDCRYDANRYRFDELDALFGEDGWWEITVEEQT